MIVKSHPLIGYRTYPQSLAKYIRTSWKNFEVRPQSYLRDFFIRFTQSELVKVHLSMFAAEADLGWFDSNCPNVVIVADFSWPFFSNFPTFVGPVVD